jgi:TPR repeat protein
MRPLATMATKWIWAGTSACIVTLGIGDTRAGVAEGVEAYKLGDFPSAYTEFLDAALTGDPVAQFLVGSLHEDGLGTLSDDNAAVRWYEKAAAQKDEGALVALAHLLLAGRGADRDEARAAVLLTDAAKLGNAKAMNTLGALYADGIGVTTSPEQALTWYRKSAEANYPAAWYNLAAMVLNGDGTEADPARALALYTKAAHQGHPGAPVNIAYLHANGIGTPTDYIAAYAWLQIGLDRGQGIARDNLEILKDRMTDRERKEADKAAQRLRESLPKPAGAPTTVSTQGALTPPK